MTGQDAEGLWDLYVCREDANLFLIVASGHNPRDVVPHHSLIYLRELDPVGRALEPAQVAARLGISEFRLAETLEANGYYIYRRPRQG